MPFEIGWKLNTTYRDYYKEINREKYLSSVHHVVTVDCRMMHVLELIERAGNIPIQN